MLAKENQFVTERQLYNRVALSCLSNAQIPESIRRVQMTWSSITMLTHVQTTQCILGLEALDGSDSSESKRYCGMGPDERNTGTDSLTCDVQHDAQDVLAHGAG